MRPSRYGFPVATKSAQRNHRSVVILNKESAALLTQEGASHVVVLREVDGSISLKPLRLSENALAVARILNGTPRSPRVSHCPLDVKRYVGRRFRCEWNDVDEKLTVGEAV